jgi:hypothetical protein
MCVGDGLGCVQGDGPGCDHEMGEVVCRPNDECATLAVLTAMLVTLDNEATLTVIYWNVKELIVRPL